jgi:S-layer family protein
VAQGFLYHNAIEKIVRAGITTGCGSGNFCANDPVTRDAMAKFLELAKNGSSFSPPAATGNVFCDVSAGTFLAKWMEQLKADGITQGCASVPCARLGGIQPDYCPANTVTRGEMASFIVRAFGL